MSCENSRPSTAFFRIIGLAYLVRNVVIPLDKYWFFAVLSGMTRFLKAWKAPFAMEGSEMLARRKRVYERGTWLVLELDSRPGRVMEQGSPKVICISNHTVSIQQLTILLGFVSKTKSIGPPACPPSRPP